MTEAKLVPAEEGGLVPEGEGWFVLNARDARWLDGAFGKYTGFEGPESKFPQLGININVLAPGEPMTMYHREDAQEDFLVVAGEAVLIVNGEERPLQAWDLFHCPPGVDHAIVGAGAGPSIVIAVGARTGHGGRGTRLSGGSDRAEAWCRCRGGDHRRRRRVYELRVPPHRLRGRLAAGIRTRAFGRPVEVRFVAVTQDELYATLDLELSWSERALPENVRTKHVHRLHPYHGKFIPQLVEVLIDRYLPVGGHVLDPFAGSGTTLVQALESGRDATGVELAAFNCLLIGVKTARYDLAALAVELREACARLDDLDLGRARVPKEPYLKRWYAPRAAAELFAFRDLTAEYEHADVLRVVLSRAARSARQAAHFDLEAPREPQTGRVLVPQAQADVQARGDCGRIPAPLHARHAHAHRGVRAGARRRAHARRCCTATRSRSSTRRASTACSRRRRIPG